MILTEQEIRNLQALGGVFLEENKSDEEMEQEFMSVSSKIISGLEKLFADNGLELSADIIEKIQDSIIEQI